MKKLLLILLTLVLATALFAIDADAELGYREAGISRANLYPEGNFYNFPSRLTQLDKMLLWTRFNLALDDLGGEVDETTGGATDGGKRETNPGDTAFDMDGSFYMALENDMVIGLRVDDNFTFTTITDTVDDGYSAAGVKVETLEKDEYYSINPQAFFAMPLGELNFGARLVSDNYIDPIEEEFTQVTNSSLNDGDMYYSDGIGAYMTSGGYNGIGLRVGIDGEAENIEWGASAYGYYRWDSSDLLVAIDSDSDGTYADKLVDYETYLNTPASEGGAGWTDASFVMEDTSLYISVNGYGKLAINDKSAIIATLGWSPVDVDNYQEYVRTDSDDKSDYTRESTAGLSNMNLTAAYAVEISDRWSLRAGTGFAFWKTTRTQDGKDYNGDSNYDDQNSNNYDEVNIAGALTNEDVVNNGIRTDRFRFQIPMEFEARFKPAKQITLFTTFHTYYNNTTETYNVFNTNDDTEWSEEVNDVDWWAYTNILGGIDVAFTENLNMVMTTNYWPQPLSFTSYTETDEMPSGDGDPTGTTSDYSETDLDVQLNFVWRF